MVEDLPKEFPDTSDPSRASGGTRKDRIEKTAMAIAAHVQNYDAVSYVAGVGAQLNIILEPDADKSVVMAHIVDLLKSLRISMMGFQPDKPNKILSIRTNFEGAEILKDLASMGRAKRGILNR